MAAREWFWLAAEWFVCVLAREVVGSADDDAGVFGCLVKVMRNGAIKDGSSAFCGVRGGVGEVGSAVLFEDEADV